MKVHMRKFKTLLKKDIKDTGKNKNVMIMLVLPLFFALIYSVMDFGGQYLDSTFVLTLTVLMTVALIPISLLSTVIAEEKEKNTLRTLMLSNVTAGEFLASKAVMTYFYMEIVNILLFFITGQGIADLFRFFLVTTLSSVCTILIGACIGMLAKDQMSTGVVAGPISILFLLPPIFSQVNDTVELFARYIPSTAMMKLFFTGNAEGWANSLIFQIAVILVWTAAAGAVFAVLFRKRRLDN